MNYKIAVIAGDGIGPEIVREARKVLDVTGKNTISLLIIRIFLWEALLLT
ncbi:MAG: hypothetical protein ACLR6B_00910 [Blautia sp.]